MGAKATILPEPQEVRSQIGGLERGEPQSLYIAFLEDVHDQPLEPFTWPVAPDSATGQDHFFVALGQPGLDLGDNLFLWSAHLRAADSGHDAKRAWLAATFLYLDQGAGAQWRALRTASLSTGSMPIGFVLDYLYRSLLITVAYYQSYTLDAAELHWHPLCIAAGAHD